MVRSMKETNKKKWPTSMKKTNLLIRTLVRWALGRHLVVRGLAAQEGARWEVKEAQVKEVQDGVGQEDLQTDASREAKVRGLTRGEDNPVV